MSINLSKNRGAILDLYNAVIDPKTSTNWALFGYEGHSNVLKVVDSGEDGLEELGPNFNSGRVEYALCSVPDQQTKLSKLILINWQGEGVQAGQLGICASHLPELHKLFHGIHCVITARCEDDVEADAILAQLKKISTAGPMISQTTAVEEPKPVTSVYQRVKPNVEINTAARDKFWEQTEKDEHTRLEREAEKRKEEAAKAEAERQRLQESITTKLQQTQPPRAAPPSKPIGRPLAVPEVSPKRQDVNDNEESDVDRERRLRSDQARMNRMREAENLIGPRSNVRAMWEKRPNGADSAPPAPNSANSVGRRWPPAAQPLELEQKSDDDQNRNSAGSCKTENVHDDNDADYCIAQSPPPPVPRNEPAAPPPVPRSEPAAFVDHEKAKSKQAPGLPQHQNVAPARPPPPNNISPSVPEDPAPAPSNGPTLKNLLANTVPKRCDSDSENEGQQDWDEPPLEEAPNVGKLSLHGDGGKNDSHINSNDTALGLRVKAMWDYQAGDDGEISFEPGDIITHVEQIDPGWWQGMAPSGKFGLFPANYVEML